MALRFTKMQGAGNDFVVLDATRAPLDLDPAQLRRLADRRFGVGCDQILVVERAAAPGVDFRYRIFNGGSGDEVEQCGNGARCFVRFVRTHGLTEKKTLVVETMNRHLELREQDDGRVMVDMGAPDFEPLHVPFDTTWLAPRAVEAGLSLWPIELGEGRTVAVAVVSMGNPHAVQIVDDVDAAPVATQGPLLERHVRFAAASMPASCRSSTVPHPPARLRARRRRDARLRHGRLRGRRGRHSPRPARCAVDVETHGGKLTIEWAGRGRAAADGGPRGNRLRRRDRTVRDAST